MASPDGDPPGATPDAGTPLGVALDRLAAEAPDAPAVICAGEVLTRGQLAERSNRLARHLARRGVSEGSLVSIGLPNGPEFYVAVVATWKLGAVPQPVSARLPPAELAGVIEVAGSAVVIGLPSPDGRPSIPAGFAPSEPGDPLPAAVPPSWKAPTSGGSTGRPKIILATQPGLLERVTTRAPAMGITPDDTLLVTAPLYHNAPFMYSLLGLLLGCPVVVMRRFDPADALRLVAEHRVTWMYAVPTMMSRILRLPEEERLAADLRSLRTVLHLAAPCPAHVKRAWIDWLGPDRILELYASTEAVAVTIIGGREWLEHPGSVGRVVAGEVAILDPSGRPVPAGEVGEVWMRAPAGRSTYRYLGATAKVRDGGWESVGDMGRFDADGYLYLADRQADMILVGGANVYPAEVEAALGEHPRVVSCCVIGLPDPDLGNAVHAIVEVDGEVSDDELRHHLGARLASYKIPRAFERSDVPLRDDAGKVRRSALRAERLAGWATP